MKKNNLSRSFCAKVPGQTVRTVGLLVLALGLLWLAPGNRAEAALIHWSGAAGDHSWANATNWDGGAIPGSADNALFDNSDGQLGFGAGSTTNNILAQDLTINSLIYSNWTAGPTSGSTSDPTDPSNLVSQHTDIGSGHTLTVTNGFIVGVSSSVSTKGFTSDPLTYATITGAGGTLAVTGGSAQIGYQSSGSATFHLYARLDMSDLGNFIYNVPGGTFGIASGVQRRQGGEVYLARTNFIGGLNLYLGIGATGVASYSAILHLGQSNVLNGNNIIIGKDTEGDMLFQSGLTNPMVTIRGANGTSPAGTVYMGWTTSTGSSFGRGTNDFTAGTVDASMTNLYVALHAGDITSDATTDSLLIGPSPSNSFTVLQNLTIGSDPGGPSTTKASHVVGLLDMQNGTFTANTVTVGSAANAGSAIGTLNLEGGTFTANSIAIGTSISSAISSGTLNLSGGTMRVTGNITVTSVVTGYSSGTIGVGNATLELGGQIGTSGAYMTSLALQQATLKLALGGGTNTAIYADAFSVEGPSSIVITSTNLSVGQFPIIAYHSFSGASGFAGLSLSLPSGVSATLVDNSPNQSVDLLVTAVPAITPVVAGCVLISPSTCKITGSGTPNQTYHVFATTNIALPQWSAIGTVNADANGVIQVLDNTTNAQRFYRLGH